MLRGSDRTLFTDTSANFDNRYQQNTISCGQVYLDSCPRIDRYWCAGTFYGTEWPIMCWCAAKKLLTHTHLQVHAKASDWGSWSEFVYNLTDAIHGLLVSSTQAAATWPTCVRPLQRFLSITHRLRIGHSRLAHSYLLCGDDPEPVNLVEFHLQWNTY